MQEHLVLASYRPTPRQALARGLYLGGLWALGLAVSGLLVWLFLAGVGVRWLPTLAAVTLAGAVLGGAAGLIRCRRHGTEVDDRGVCAVGYPSWPDVVDLRAERRGGRIEVRAYLDGGGCVRLPAPYDGRLLAHDPGFELKYLTLRQVWESHRNWNSARSH
jgi:hypothetical protein